MPERFLTFDCVGEALAGIVHEPERQPSDIGVLVVVGGPQYRVGSHRQFVLMARQLSDAGYPVFRLDYRGMGDSEGEPHTFEAVDDDICAALDAFVAQVPALRRIVLFGLCDAASAVLMYCAHRDLRVDGLILANPWVRTEAGQAKALVHHYYGRRLLQRSFWHKMWSGQLDVLASLKGFMGLVKRSARAGAESPQPSRHFTQRMLTGLGAFPGPVLLLMSGRDLTAREFDEFTKASRDWSILLQRRRVQRVDLPQADHTFSGTSALAEATRSVVGWLGDTSRR